MNAELITILSGIGSTVLWTAVSIVLVVIVVEVLNWRYRMLEEIFKENAVGPAIFAGSFVIGIFYTVVQIVTH